MRILILGNNHSAESFYYNLSKNKQDIVFATCSRVENYIEYENEDDIVDFCSANEINFVLVTEEKYINVSLQEKLISSDITVFSPSPEAIGICKYKSNAKKFINKNKFLSPKYFIAERSNLAFDYLKTSTYPLAIRPDEHSYRECSQFVETFGQAQKVINKFFESGNKKIIIEDYIQGKNVVIWAISDGYSAKIIGTNARYQNNIGLFEPEFLDNETKDKILNEIINPAISSLAQQGEEYIGILGFDFMVDSKQNPYLVGFNGFFDDISVDFYTKCYDINWIEIFESCVVGDIFTKYEIKSNDEYALTIRTDEDIKFINARIKSNLKKYVEELDYNTDEFKEAVKLWKY